MRNSNFSFIQGSLPDLHKLATHAEQTVDHNPMIALNHLKQMGRWFVVNILAQEHIKSEQQEPLADLEVLIRNEIVPAQFISTLKQLEYMDTRESELLVDPSGVKRLFLQLYDWTGWYYKTYIDDEYVPSPMHLRSDNSNMQLTPKTTSPAKNPVSHIDIDGLQKEGTWEEPLEHEHTVDLNGNERYRGQLFQGMKHGHGAYHWNDGTRYTGQWSRDREHGTGEKLYANGDAYRGEWAEGLFHGYGVYIWKDGARYEGRWEHNLEHGFGIKIQADGTIQKGFWTHGEYVFTEDQLKEGLKNTDLQSH